MILNMLISLCCSICTSDTLDAAGIAAHRDITASSLSPMHTITQAEAEQMGMLRLHEAVRHLSGVSVKDYGGAGGLKTVSVRNMGASHTAVVYDGISVSDAQNGQTDISRFNLDDLESISITIGPQEDIYCSARHINAAGILHIKTTAPVTGVQTTEMTARMTAGSFGTYNPYVSFRHSLGKNHFLSLSANGSISKGNYPFTLKNGDSVTRKTRTNSDLRSFGCEADFHADWATKGKLRAKVNYHSSERGLPGSVILYTDKAYERLWNMSVISNVMYDLDIGNRFSFHADAGFNTSQDRHLDTAPVYQTPQESRYLQNEYTLAARIMYTPAMRWKFVIAEDCFVNTLDSNIPECPFPIRLSSITALSARYSGKNVTARMSLAATSVAEELNDTHTTRKQFRLSPMIGISWNFAKGAYLRSSFKEGFRTPTFNDLYYARVGNTALKPETARQFNLGITYTTYQPWGYSRIVLDTYYTKVKDKITAVPTMFIWKMKNVGNALIYGSDLTISGKADISAKAGFDWGATWSLQYALDVTDIHAKNYRHQIPYVPRHCGNGHLTFRISRFNMTYRVSFSGERYVKSQNIPANKLEGYADHCLSVNTTFETGRKRPCRIMLSIEALNLTDVNYELINFYPMPGRHFRFTIKFNHISHRK